MRQKGIPLWPFLAPHKLSLSFKSFIQMFLVQVCRISYRPHLTKLCNCNLATLKCSLNGISSAVSTQSAKRNDQKMFSTMSVVQIFLWRDRVGFQSQIHLNWRRQILLSRYSSCYAAIREGSQRTNWTELQFANSSQSTSWRWRAWPITRRVTGSTWCRSVQFSSSAVTPFLSAFDHAPIPNTYVLARFACVLKLRQNGAGAQQISIDS